MPTRFIFATLLALSGVFALPSSLYAQDLDTLTGHTSGITSTGQLGRSQYIEVSDDTYITEITFKVLKSATSTEAVSVSIVECPDNAPDNFIQDCVLKGTDAISVSFNKDVWQEVTFDLPVMMYASSSYFALLQENDTSYDNAGTSTQWVSWATRTGASAPDYLDLGSFQKDRAGYDDYDNAGSMVGDFTIGFRFTDTGLSPDGFNITIDSVTFLDTINDIAYDTDCTATYTDTYTRGCNSATSTSGVAVEWTFITNESSSHTLHAQMLLYDGSVPYGQNPDLYNLYYDDTALQFTRTSNFVTARVTYNGIATTTDNFIFRICAEPNDFLNGAYGCLDMVICNGSGTDDQCQEEATSVAYGADILDNVVPASCSLGDVLCYLKIAFIPSSAFMTGLVQQASSTVMSVWPIGYLTREWYAYNSATSSEFDIPLDMSSFGLPTTNASINLTEASQGVYALSDTIDDFVDLLETICWALFWLLLAYHLYNGKQTVHQLAEV